MKKQEEEPSDLKIFVVTKFALYVYEVTIRNRKLYYPWKELITIT